MADIESNVKVNIDTTDALSQLKLLQQQISAFQQAMRKAGADNAAAARAMQSNLANSINATGKFQANIQTIQTSAERFTGALEKNKLTMGEYFRYAGGASKTFGKLFKSEFETINQVARERVKELQTQYIKLGRDANGAMKAIAVRPLALDMDNLGTKTQIAAQRQQLFNQLMKQGSTNLLNFGKNTQWAGRQLMVGFTVPLTMMGSAAAKAYMEIEKASISFKRVYGDINTTADETEKMVSSVRQLANEFTKYGVAVSDTMDMAAKAAAMGKTGADLLTQIGQANKLAVLGQVDQNQALETTISLTNAFGTSAEDLSSKIDFLNAVENQTVTSIEDLTIAIPKAAPVVKQLGGNVEDLTFFLTAMKEGGINASEGANALKSGLASMINPSKQASQFLQSFGINVKGIVESDKGNVKKTVIDMAKAFDTLDPLNRARAIEQMFGKFQFSRISTLFQNVIKEGSQANAVAGLASQTAEELAVLSEREMKKISDSPMYKFQKSIEDIQAKLAPVGEAFLKAVTPIIEFVSKILDGFNNLSDGTKSFVTILVTAVAGIGPLLLMTFGLIANGVANIMKLFTNMKGFINKTTKPSDILGEQTGYMTTEQLKGAAIAASLDQAHAKLRQTFTSEAGAVNALADAYRNAITAQQAFSGVPGVPTGNPNAMTPKKYANGVSMVPGPNGAGDIVPALLSPGEAVIPARHAKKYAPVIAGMVAGNLPGFENGTTGVGMRQSIYGPLTVKQTEGLARTGVQLKDISDEVMAGPYANVPPTDFGTQITPTTGHSFPAFEVGGIYQKPDGTKVFVKPQIDLTGAMAEVRGTEIARSAHGLVAPKQDIRVMMDPTDPEQKRRFLVLESALDEKIANIQNKFTNEEYFTQHVAALLRGDKDLGVGNLGGNVLADVGPAGVFGRASGKRALGSAVNSMEEQAIINLLGVKGGAKRFFAETTSEQISKLTPAQYDAAMKAEMQKVAPKLQATIAGFGNMSPEETAAYQAIQQRLQAGMGVDWGKYQVMHSGVKPKEYKKGVVSAGFASPNNPMAFAQALQAMNNEQIKKELRIQDTHLVGALDIKDPKFLAQVQRVYPGATPEELELFEPVSNLTAQFPGNANQVMKGKSGYPGSFFKTVWNGLENKLSKTAQIAGISLNESQTIENEIGNVIGNYPELINDTTMGDIVGQVLGSTAKITDDAMMKRRMWELSERVASLRSKPKKANIKPGGIGGEDDEGDAGTTEIIRKMLQDDALYWDKTTLRRKLSSGKEGPRFGGVNIDQFGHSSGSLQDIAARRLAQQTLQELIANPNMPMPRLPRSFNLPENWDKASAGMSDEQQIAQLISMAKQGRVQVLNNNDNNLAKRKPGKPAPLSFTKRDADDKTFNIGKEASGQAYNSSRLKGSPLNWASNQTNVLDAYNAMSQPFGSFASIIPQTASSLKFFNDLALKMEKGGIVPGATGKPKASVFDIDDTLLDLSSFMIAHKAENEKLPEGEKKKWYKEVAKDPKGIPAGLAALRAAQQRGNKIMLMTARPDFYEPYTRETLEKLGIDMNGIKLIARKDKDYRKPEQMKYDKTSALMKYYDIEEFYDDMDKTRGAISLLGIPTHNPLKLANGVFSVPGPKGAGDVVPAMLSPGEAVIPAKQAGQHRGMISQMIAGKLPGYSKGISKIPGVPDPEPYVPEESTKSSGLFSKIANTIVESSKKAGDILVSKAKDAGEKVAGQLVDKLINPNNDRLTDSKGRVINEDRIAALEAKKAKKNVEDENVVIEDKNSNIQLTREQIEEQLSLTDKDYEQALRRQEQLKLLTVLSDKEKEQFAKDQELINRKEDAWLQERGASEKKASKGSGFFTRNQTTAKVQTSLYAASGALASASMIPGQIGEAAQQMLPAVGAATTAMSLIPGPAGMVVAGFAVVGTVIGQINTHLDKLRDESFKLAIAMGNGREAMSKFSEFAKTVSGTEAMDKRRQQSAGQFFNVVQGKTTFGESYMKGDTGKQLVKDVSQSIKQGGLGEAKTLITTQLSTAIASGVMTPAQARSIAANLGAQLGDMSFGMEVSGRLLDIMGPNGENLKNEPLLVRMKVVEASMGEFEKTASKTTGAKMGGNNVGTAVGSGVAGAVGGTIAGLGAGVAGGAIAAGLGGAAATGFAGGTAAILGAQAFGPVVGVIAGLAIATTMIVNYQGEVAKQAGQLEANLGNALTAQQQMVDSLQVDYEKRIASARAAGDTAEATRLQNQYLVDQAKLLEVNSENMKSMYKTLDTQSTGFLGIGDMQTALGNTANEAIKKAFEGTGQEVGAQLATDTINGMAGATNNQKTMIKTMVAQKLIGFDQLGTANQVFGGSEEGAKQFQKLLEQSPTEANRALGLAGNLKGEDQKKFLIDMSLKDPAATKLMNDALEMAQQTSGVFFGQKKVAEAVMKYSIENPEQMLQFKDNIDKLKAEKTIDIKVVQKILGPSIAKLLGNKDIAKYFGKYNKQNKVTFLTELQQVMAMEGDPAMIASWNLWNKENGQTKSFAEYAAYQADRTVTSFGVDNTGVNDGGKQDQQKTGPDPSILDPYVKMLREANNWQQKLTVGWDASYKAIMRYGSAAVKQMGGIAVLMKQQGADADIIRDFMNGTEEEQNRIVDKKTGKLRAHAGELLKKLKQIKDASEIGLTYVLATPAERLAKDNELYQAGLDVISNKEKKINEKYDARAKALDEIGKIQDKNNQRQQDTMSLADALSKGDIAAAAKAALQAKQNDQKTALDDAKSSIENARKIELEGVEVRINGVLTDRTKLEKTLQDNAEKIADFKLKEAQRTSDIAKSALVSANAMAKMLKDGKALSLVKPYNAGPVGSGPTGVVDKNKDKDKNKDTAVTATTAGSAISGIAKTAKFGGKATGRVLADMKSGLTGLSSTSQANAEKSAESARMKVGQQGQSKGFAVASKWKNGVAIGWKAKDRNFLDPSKLAAYDEWVEQYANANKAKSDIKSQYEEKKTTAFESFPTEIQTALATLKSYNEQKKTAGEALKNANAAFEKIGIQKDSSGEYRGSPRSTVKDAKSIAAYNEAYKPIGEAINQISGLTKNISYIQQALNAKGYTEDMTEFYVGKRYAKGGMVYASNGIHVASSKYALGTDTIPAMLTPGEFVMRKSAVDSIGAQELSKMNARGKDAISGGESVYNYSITVNANSSDANDIADSVLREIKRIDSRRIRSSAI